MSLLPFTIQNARMALARQSDSLRASGVNGVWVDMSGSGWTQSYIVAIGETNPIFETVVPSMPVADGDGFRWETMLPVQVTRLRETSKDSVEKALAHLSLPDQIEIEFRANCVSSTADQVWPARDMMIPLREKIASLQAEIKVLEELEELSRRKSNSVV